MKRVGILMGGPSHEHDVSLMTGKNVQTALEDHYEAIPIYVAPSGEWFFGAKRQWVSPGDALARVDVVFNALHGTYGEDGTVQKILHHFRIPYTGPEALPAAVAMNKEMSQGIFASIGLRTPRGFSMNASNLDAQAVLQFSSPPWIVKPRSSGSSVGVSKVRTKNELEQAFAKALAYDTHLVVQEYIPGCEITCGVLENFGGKSHAALVPIEIVVPHGSHFFDYQAKYNGRTQEICPANFHGAMLALVQKTAIEAHKALGLRHYSRTDMILKTSDKTRRAPELYVLETNALPGLTRESLLPKAARFSGLEFPQLITHILSQTGVV